MRNIVSFAWDWEMSARNLRKYSRSLDLNDQQRPHEYAVMMRAEQRLSVHGIVTPYELKGPGIEFPWGDIFLTRPDSS